jgi:DNA-binding transcriptional LysR family regulator
VEVIAALQRSRPLMRVSVFTTERRVELVEDGIDVALRVGAGMHEAMVGRRLFSYRHLLVASPGLLARFGEVNSPEDLRQMPCGAWCRDSPTSVAWRLGEQAFEPAAALVANHYQHLRARAMAGELVTELPPFLAHDAVHRGEFQLRLPAFPMPGQDISLLYPSRRVVSSIVRACIDFCQSRVAGFFEEREVTSPSAGPGRPAATKR